ncbi:PhoH family protein [candidate division TA06 bacterium]|uniref:PhoH-like protein n=1 Tax=candidate division TA06 bacterium TaxID=2250710 RepID=A0A523UYN7_UNCT6|nr:MAG: PhoH family protein [candidate division TA06 bacterium]
MSKRTIEIEGIDWLDLLGEKDANLRLIEDSFESKISVRGEKITITGPADDVKLVDRLFRHLVSKVESGTAVGDLDVRYAIDIIRDEGELKEEHKGSSALISTPRGAIRAKTKGQEVYVEAIHKYDMVVSIGPAGTGKTYLAVAKAVSELNRRSVDRIILCRPAVEAGESLGFLPGDFREKIDPYLRPLYDALREMIPPERMRRLMENGTIEIAPLAYMRGRTLNDSFVILDEAQNTTSMQMKMFLTRLGFKSKAVITGDITQIDLQDGTQSGLVEIIEILKNISGIKFVRLSGKDVVRHRLVCDIIDAYETYSEKKQD